ncbi:peptidase T [Gudongella sp. DL1XJH-153]|uniref:peptidase T n=1 Tax=Gudongella sp. DL1XJH-153 TaxID=3409804 RepID=UPI003BB731A0
MENLANRFLNYVKFETTSDESSVSVPSTESQLKFARILADELGKIGMSDVSLDEKGYVMATLPNNTERELPVIGFIAHMDTSPDMSGKNVNPQIFENFQGEDLVLNKDKGIILSPDDFPELKENIGKTIITTDGTTLLGADNKAGIAEIITAMEYFLQNPDIPHGEIKVGFTPDEEIGRGADHFNVEKFGADFAYTVDGGPVGELEYENFNAASATVNIQGRNVHPGSAKNKMINSLLIAQELNSMLPVNERPEYTDNYEGFFHLMRINGTVEETEMSYIIRDHFKDGFEKKKNLITEIADFLNIKYGDVIALEIKDSYYNMKEQIEPVMEIVELAREAMEDLGIEVRIKPVRGGTDGSKLSYMGLPCPNIFTGGYNFHGKYEYVTIEGMELATRTILEIIILAEKRPLI